MTQIVYPGGATSTFGYNGLDTRTSQNGPSGVRNYLRDGAYVTDPVVQDGWAVYTPTISQVRSGTVRYNHSGLKSMDIQSTASQTISSTIHRDAFGNQTSINGAWTGPFGYAGGFGYQQDADSGLMLLGHRYYDPSTGRFLTRDPIKDGRNWYSYGGGLVAPTHGADPDGLLPILLVPLLIKGGGKGLIGGAAGRGLIQGGLRWLPRAFPRNRPSPNPDGSKGGPQHRDKTNQRENQIKLEHPDWEHLAGGTLSEREVPTQGGYKPVRRPDLIFKKPDGTYHYENIGRTTQEGYPIAREMRAILDLLRNPNADIHFTGYP
jgi:RHS repeat-associated protein